MPSSMELSKIQSASPFRLLPGLKVWIRNPYPAGDDLYREQWLPSRFCGRPIWVPAEIAGFSPGTGNEVVVSTLLQPRMTVRVLSEHLLPMNAVTGLDSLAEFVYLHEAAVLYNVTRRLLEGRPVTRAGPNLLLSVNPCRVLTDSDGFNTLDVVSMARFRARLPSRILDALPPSQRSAVTLPPHLFEAADAAHSAAMGDSAPHNLLFLGDTGSGKSEALKGVLQFLVCLRPLCAAGVRPGTVSLRALRVALAGLHEDIGGRQGQEEAPGSLAYVAYDLAAAQAGEGGAGPASLLSLSESDKLYSRQDASRRRGPLGSARNPWAFQPLPGLGVGAGAAVLAPKFADFYSEDAGPVSSEQRRLGRANAVAALSATSSIPQGVRAVATGIGRVGRVLLAAQTALEAFGCAATPSNANSSRFVRVVKVILDESGHVCGGRLSARLMDSRRVLGASFDPKAYGMTRTKSGSGEIFPGVGTGMPPPGRNFHIFYQLLAGASRDTRQALQLGAQADYLALQQPKWAQYGSSGATLPSESGAADPPSDAVQHVHGTPLPSRSGMAAPMHPVNGVPGTVLSAFSTALFDGEELSCTVKALEEVGIDTSNQSLVFRLLSALLIGCNVRFDEGVDGAAKVATPTEAALLADLLSVDRARLGDALVKKARGSITDSTGLTAPGQTVSWTPRTPSDARAALDGLITGLYERLFLWLVARINMALEAAGAGLSPSVPHENDVVLAGARAAAPTEREAAVFLVDGPGLEGALPLHAETALNPTSPARPSGSEPIDASSPPARREGVPIPVEGAPIAVDVDRASGLDGVLTGYVSERMQDAFLNSLFRQETALYGAEGIEYDELMYEDSSNAVLDLLADKRAGLLASLDEACAQTRTNDAALTAKMAAASRARGAAFLKPQLAHGSSAVSVSDPSKVALAPQAHPGSIVLVSSAAAAQEGGVTGPISAQGAGYDPSLTFGVRHSGGTVLYSAAGWIAAGRTASGPDMNRADVDLLTVLASSGNPLVGEALGLMRLGATLMGVASPQARHGARQSVGDGEGDALVGAGAQAHLAREGDGCLPLPAPLRPSYRAGTTFNYGARTLESIDDVIGLVMPAESTPSTFVRCIRPNAALQPTYADPSLLHSQLVHSGALHAVAARHTGFPARFTFADFFERYVLVVLGQEDETDRQRKAAGLPVGPRKFVFPPARSSDMRELCKRVLATAALHPVFAPLRAELKATVQFGRTRVFMKAHVYDTLEALREVRLSTMDRQAVRIQSVWRACRVRGRVHSILAGMRRLQAAWQAAQARAAWMRVRRAAIRIQGAYRRFSCQKRYTSMRHCILKLQEWVRTINRTRSWRIMRRGLQQLHATSRGFIIRCHVMRMLAAVSKIQATARMFCIRSRVARYKNEAATALQCIWRGRRFRVYNEELLAELAGRRERRMQRSAAVGLQALWKGGMARAEYSRVRTAAVVMQRWVVSRLARGRFNVARAGAVRMQALIRGALCRSDLSRQATLHAVADELWRVHQVRKLELAELSRATAEDAVLALPPALRGAVAASAGVHVSYVAPSSPSGSLPTLPPRIVQVTARTAQPGSDAAGGAQGAFTATQLLDVDATSDTLVVHPATISRSFLCLERELRACGTRLGGMAVGSTHAMALAESGHVYTWGFGDRGQTGHGRWGADTAPRLLEALLSDRDLATAAERAQPVAAGSGSGRVTPSREGKAAPPVSAPSPSLSSVIRIKSIAAGEEHSLALSETGRLYAWGNGRRGAHGLGSWESVCSPALVRLTVREGEAAALPARLAGEGVGVGAGDMLRKSSLDVTGDEAFGLGDELTRVVEIGAGSNHSIALSSAGIVFTWGDGSCLGAGVFSGNGDVCTPAPVRDLLRHRIRHIASGPSFLVVVSAQGDVYSWGSGKDGQLGHGEEVYKAAAGAGGGGVSSPSGEGFVAGRFRHRFRPTQVEGFAAFDRHARITGVAAGSRHVLALSSTGRVYAWGSNSHGQLGLGVPGPLPETALRKAGVPVPTLPLADRPHDVSGVGGGAPHYTPRPYSAVPAWVWTLDQHHVTFIAAAGRGSSALTDRKEVFAWGATFAASSLLDADALLLRAYAVLRGVHLPSASASASAPADEAGAKAGAGDLFPPIQLLDAGRGPLELNVVPFPVPVPVHAVPGRVPKKLITASSASVSLLAMSYTQSPVLEGAVRDTALARAVAPLTTAGASHAFRAGYSATGASLGGGAPPLSVLVAGALADMDLRNEVLSKGGAAAKGAAVVTVPASPQSGPAPPTAAVASPATARLTALVTLGQGGGGADRKSVHDAVYRGVVGIPGVTRGTGGGGAAAGTSAFKAVVPSASQGGSASNTPMPSPACADESAGPTTQLPAAYVASLRLHPAVVDLAQRLARDAPSCAALLNLSPDQLRALTPRQAGTIMERLCGLSGVGSPGRRAGTAAGRALARAQGQERGQGPSKPGLPLSPRPAFMPGSLSAAAIASARVQADTAAAMTTRAFTSPRGAHMRSPPPPPAPASTPGRKRQEATPPTLPRAVSALPAPSVAAAAAGRTPLTVRAVLASAGGGGAGSVRSPPDSSSPPPRQSPLRSADLDPGLGSPTGQVASYGTSMGMGDADLLAARARLSAAAAARNTTINGADSPPQALAPPAWMQASVSDVPMPDFSGMDEDAALAASLQDMQKRMEAAKVRAIAMAALAEADSPSTAYVTMQRAPGTGSFNASAALSSRLRPKPQ